MNKGRINKGKNSRSKLWKKAQIEMIGLVIIVIIVITALLIFTVYKLTHPSKNIQKSYMNKEVATNLLITMTHTSIPGCHNFTLRELVVDCAKTYHTTTCGDYTSCEIANQTIYTILNRTLVDWDIGFKFEIEGTEISFVNLNCDSVFKEKVQGFEILPLYPGDVEMTLDICTS